MHQSLHRPHHFRQIVRLQEMAVILVYFQRFLPFPLKILYRNQLMQHLILRPSRIHFFRFPQIFLRADQVSLENHQGLRIIEQYPGKGDAIF